MEDQKYYEMIHRIQTLEDKLQRQEKTSHKSSDIIEEIQQVLQEIKVEDKENEGKIRLFEHQLEQLKGDMSEVSDSKKGEDDRKRDLWERAGLVLLGTIVTFLFSLLKG